MNKLVKLIIVIVCIVIVIVGVSHLFRRHRYVGYSQPYSTSQSYNRRHSDSLVQVAVKSAVRGASTYAGYHIAKSIHRSISTHRMYRNYGYHSRRHYYHSSHRR